MANCAPVPGPTEATTPWKGRVGKSVDSDVDLLPDPKIGDVGFFGIGVDPRRTSSSTLKMAAPAVDEAADLNVVDLRGDAGDRSLHYRVVEIALSLVERRLGLAVGGKFSIARLESPCNWFKVSASC